MLIAGEIALGVQERFERGVGPGAAHGPEVAVDLVRIRQLLDERRVVRRAERREDLGDDVPAGGAEVGDETRRRRPAEAVVVGDHGDGVPSGVVVHGVAETGVPLGAVTVVPEEVRRLHVQRGVLGTGDAVDEGDVRMIERIVGDGDSFVSRERADHDVGPVLLDEGADLLHGAIGGVVTATDPHQFDGDAAHLGAAESVERGVGRLRRRPRLVDQGERRARDDVFVEAAERAFALGHDAETNAVAGRCRAAAGGSGRRVLGGVGGRPCGGVRSGVCRCFGRAGLGSLGDRAAVG